MIIAAPVDDASDLLTDDDSGMGAAKEQDRSHESTNARCQTCRIVMEQLEPLEEYYDDPQQTLKIVRDAMLCYFELYWVGGYVQADV